MTGFAFAPLGTTHFGWPTVAQTLPDLESLLDYLKRTRGFDFTGYKRASLERRIAKRMEAIGTTSFGDYLDYLEVHPEEFSGLFNTVLINVTHFFRDTSTWEFVASTIVPDLIARHEGGTPLRIWSAGCASGEEAYTLAMIFAEALGLDAFRDRVKIYATDVDEDALAKARLATYTEREVADVPPEFLERYFDAPDAAGRRVFRKDVRRHVIFGRHDLIQDAPISRVDLLVCRNTLMYFNAETQAKILGRFQFALNDHGVLFLGRAETLMTHASTFAPLDLKHRVSTKLPSRNGHLRTRLLAAVHNGDNATEAPAGDRTRIREAALDAAANAQMIIDANGGLAFANHHARRLFGLSASDIARPLQDLKISYRPLELRSLIDQVSISRRAVVIREVEWLVAPDDVRWLDVHVAPLTDADGHALLGVSISFVDVSVGRRLRAELEQATHELETAYEELQSTNEELETTNEELQSTVEELETTNEELQSTNEELETMNEELQSANEELQTTSDETRLRSDELNEVNGFLESILTSLRAAVVVVDADLKVLVWNQRAEDMWGLRAEEARGKHILGLDVGLPIERLKQPMRACLTDGDGDGHTSLTLEAINRRGRPIQCQITTTPLRTRSKTVHGVILVIEDGAAQSTGNGNRTGVKRAAKRAR
jgi:two-component system, chemotaxis family, CheB/CheR fusion protein